jgi:hypothetical protein
MGAIELVKIDEIVKNRMVITDNSLLDKISENAFKAISYQVGDFSLGDILYEISKNKEPKNWQELKPLYIQPPPVFGK